MRDITLLFLALIVTPLTLSSKDQHLFGSDASFLTSSICKKHKCTPMETRKYTSTLDNKEKIIEVIRIDYNFPAQDLSSKEYNTVIVTLVRSNRKLIDEVEFKFSEHFNGTAVLYADAKFAIEALKAFTGQSYVLRPRRGDDINSKCYSWLDKDNQIEILYKGATLSKLNRESSYVIYCAIYPGSQYPAMFPKNESFYKVRPVLVISDSVHFKPAKQFTP